MPARRARLVGFGSILQIGTSNLSFTLDTAVPAVPIIGSITDNVGLTQGPLANGDQTDDPTLTLTGTAETGATIKAFNGATQLSATTADSGDNWSVTTTELADGLVSLTATATDTAGNTSATSTARRFTVDTTVPCFCAGASIRTSAGEVSVEALVIGNLVVTVSGELKPIRWIGQRHYGRTAAVCRTLRCRVYTPP
jgi:hypothetical protein